VKQVGPACLAIIAIALVFGSVSIAGAQPPIRIGASLSQTGAYAVAGQNQLRGYQLCVKHTNDKGGLLGRRLELVVEDDRSEPATAVRIYEKLITQDKVNAVLSPYTSPIIDAVAEVSEKHRMPLVAFGAAASAVFKKGRKFLFMVQSPAEVWLEGYTGAYPTGNTEFAAILTRARSAIPDAFGAATRGLDAEAVTRQIKALDMNPKMYAVTIGGALPRFYETLGRNAEFVYVPSEWEPELVTLRAGGLIPIARQYPGARELVEAHHREYPGADLSYHTAGGYGGCQVLAEAVKRSGSLDGGKIRDAILKLDFNTVFGAFRVDPDGLQIAHKLVLFQWQDGKKVIVWPEELAPGRPRFPTPPWSQRQ